MRSRFLPLANFKKSARGVTNWQVGVSRRGISACAHASSRHWCWDQLLGSITTNASGLWSWRCSTSASRNEGVSPTPRRSTFQPCPSNSRQNARPAASWNTRLILWAGPVSRASIMSTQSRPNSPASRAELSKASWSGRIRRVSMVLDQPQTNSPMRAVISLAVKRDWRRLHLAIPS
jgi:hypothetical protein